MSILLDPRLDHISHYGTKGMKWGIRKKIYTRQKNVAEKYKRSANEFQTAADAYSKGPQSKAKMSSAAKNLRKAADQLDEDAATDPNKNSAALKRRDAKLGRDFAKKLESAEKMSKEDLEKSYKKGAEVYGQAAKASRDEARRWDIAAAKTKAKMDGVQTELSKETPPAYFKNKNGEPISRGKAAVNEFFTGNTEGRVTKGVAAQYLVGAGVVGYLGLKHVTRNY